MQATSDAQGDFARTSGDSFANMKRQLQTNLSSIEASIGTLLIGPISDATGYINDFLAALSPEEKPDTVLDEINRINIDTETKIGQINTVAAEAKKLVSELEGMNSNGGLTANSELLGYLEQLTGDIGGLDEALDGASGIKEDLTKIADGSNKLGAGTGIKWSLFVSALNGLGGEDGTNLQSVANALATNIGGDAAQWETLLTTIGTKLGACTTAVGNDEGATAAFMQAAAEAADDLGSDYSTLWSNLLGALGDKGGAAVSAFADAASAATNIGTVATNANTLNASSPKTWESLLSALQTIDGLENIFKQGAGQNVEDLANALSGNAPDTSKAEAWATFLDALGTNAGVLSTLTGESAEDTAAWLNAMKEAASGLDEGDAAAWNLLLSNFVTGLPALKDTEGGKAFFDAMAANFLAMGNESEEARSGLAALGYESDDIASAQDRWLKICQQLVRTIPELSSIINTQTGEIDGGTQAVKDYIAAWQEDKIIQTKIDGLKKQRELLYNAMTFDYEAAAMNARAKLYGQLVGVEGYTPEEAERYINSTIEYSKTAEARSGKHPSNDVQVKGANLLSDVSEALGLKPERKKLTQDTIDANNELIDALVEQQNQLDAIPHAMEYYDKQLAELEEQTGKSADELLGMADAADESAENLSQLERAAKGDKDAMQAVTDAVNSASEALEALADYQERVRNETEQAVRGVINGFSSIETPMQKARKQVDDLKKQMDGLTDEKEIHEFEIRISDAEGSMPTIQSMTAGLKSQLEYMQEYQRMLTEARAKGVSEDILATLSDGSQESYDYLYALTQYGGNIEELNQAYKDVQDEAEKFTNTLTNQKLTADEAYQSLVETAQNAIDSLNMGDQAYASVEATVQAIVNALGDKAGDVKTQVDNILAQIARLSTASGGGGFFSSGFGAMLSGMRIYQPHANGIDNVPFDGYLALLHQGERVQTAAEADLSRRYSYQQPSFDYDAMGGAIGANMPRGNVYLDGQTVGRVISDRQANSYRALERSGWQG